MQTPSQIGQEQDEPDIVELVLQKCMAAVPGLAPAQAAQIGQEIKATHGGKRHFIPKGEKRLSAQEKQALYQDGLSQMSNGEIQAKHKISRATLYRHMKSGGRFS